MTEIKIVLCEYDKKKLLPLSFVSILIQVYPVPFKVLRCFFYKACALDKLTFALLLLQPFEV